MAENANVPLPRLLSGVVAPAIAQGGLVLTGFLHATRVAAYAASRRARALV
jgi:hypothetical protein